MHFMKIIMTIQSDFEGCADILTCDRTPQKVTIEPMMLIQMLIFFEKMGFKIFEKSLGATECFGKMGQK
jgi:hypothetical protein